MGYVAAKGGLDAILAAERLVQRKRVEGDSAPLAVEQVTERLRLAVDRVMGEGGLWAPELAARAVRQAEGDLIEAAQLLRSFRSTLPRLAYSMAIDADELVPLRRVVPAYRAPSGPQLLGRTIDYTSRLLERNGTRPVAPAGAVTGNGGAGAAKTPERPAQIGRLYDELRAQDLVVERRRDDDPEPFDITRHSVRPGAPRSARLAAMARAETGALVNLWYRNILGPDRHLHEITLGEVRHGRLPVRVTHPRSGVAVEIGRVRATEVEGIEDLNRADHDRARFDVGYGCCLGHNERKAIAMANLDIAVQLAHPGSGLEQSVLMTTDGLDASGFCEHLKLPHYVTFRSMIERKQAVRAGRARQSKADAERGGQVGV